MSLNKNKIIQVIQNMFSVHHGIKLGVNTRKMSRKFPNNSILNNTLLKSIWVKKVMKGN